MPGLGREAHMGPGMTIVNSYWGAKRFYMIEKRSSVLIPKFR
jgi:hypothetical protein